MDKSFEADLEFSTTNIKLAGDDFQQLNAIQNLPQLLQREPPQPYTQVIPKILEELPNASCEFQVVTSKMFKNFVEKQVPPNLFYAVLQGIESEDTIVANSWMETLVAIIPVLNESQLKTKVLPLVNAKSQLSQPLLSRVAACNVLGKIAVHACFDATDVKRDIVPLVQSLCQDCHPEVRSAICTQFPNIAQGLGSGLMRGDLLACLVELGSDENVYVRSASVSAIVQIFPHTSLDVKKATLLPLIKQLCSKSLKHGDVTTCIIAQEIGKIVDGLQNDLSKADCRWFVNFYKSLATKGLDENSSHRKEKDGAMDTACRQHAAINLPAMSVFVNTLLPTHMEDLYLLFKDLATDPCVSVRAIVAGCIHEIITIFDSASKIFKSDFVHLLEDDSEEVVYSLVPNLGATLELFHKFEILSKQTTNAAMLEIGRALLKCHYELSSGNDWRLFAQFLHQLERLPNCMPSDFIHHHFTPILLTCAVEGRVRPVRVQAVRTLLVFLRNNDKEVHRRWLRENLFAQLGKSGSYYTRLLYVKLCGIAIEIFSEKYFKEYFYYNLLDMAVDPVANIRLSIANLFASLKQMLTLPEDKLLEDRFQGVLKRYRMMEEDRDVKEALCLRIKEINDSVFVERSGKEEKRRRDEEDRISTGAKPASITRVPVVNRTAKSCLSIAPQRSCTKLVTSPRISRRLTNSASKEGLTNLCNQMSDMSILEQHFYIDAGVNLPTKALDRSGSSVSLTGNITDDDKVSLRKLPTADVLINKSAKKVKKRYSSVLSETCLLRQEQKVVNRRSLNLSARATSRIPVSRVKNKAQSSETAIPGTRTSQLPIRCGSGNVKK